MTKPKLLFLSWEYPYRPGEAPFITPSFPALTEAFDLRLRACLNTGTKAEAPIPCPVPFAPAQKGNAGAALWHLLLDGCFYREVWGILKEGGGFSTLRTRLGVALYSYLHSHRFALGLYAECKKDGFVPDVGYSFWGQEGAYALLLLKKRFPEMKAVSRFHGCDLYLERGAAGYLPFRGAFSKDLDRLYFISNQGLSYFKTTYAPVLEDRLSLSLLGCPPAKVTAKPDFTKLVMVTCARVAPEKRMELLVEGLALVPPDVTVEWHHVGDGPGFDALLRQAETLLAKKENITCVFHGQVENAALRPLYEKIGARLLVNTSSSEGLPVTMMEAFSMGIPVMGTNVGGVSELVSEHTGVLLPGDPDPEQVAAALTAFAKLPEKQWNRLSKNAAALWKRELDAGKNAKVFTQDLLGLIPVEKQKNLCYTAKNTCGKGASVMGKFVIRNKNDKYSFVLKAGNGEIILVSETYAAEDTCKNGIASVKKNALAHVEDQTKEGYETLKHPKYEVYQDKAGEYRFRLKAINGEIIGTGEGYKAKASCLNGIASIGKNAPEAEIVEEA